MATYVDLACNDPDNGNFVSRFHMLQVRVDGDDGVDFEGPWCQSDGIVFRVERGIVRVGRLKVPILGYKNWVGNWCWDSIRVEWQQALRIINYLGRQKAQGWHISCGPAELCDAFDARHEITPEEWAAVYPGESNGKAVSAEVSTDGMRPTHRPETQASQVLLTGVQAEGSPGNAQER